MSSRNYSPFQGPLGKYRRDVPVPEVQPSVDMGGLERLAEWREERYKQPFLDDLLGHYRFFPSVAGAEAYAGKTKLRFPGGVRKATGREAAIELIEAKHTAQRQVMHKAETAELATAVFWSVAELREVAIDETNAGISSDREFNADAAVFAADAVVDFGLCLEEPYESNWYLKRGPNHPTPQGLKVQLDRIAPDIGTQLADFGSYAIDHPDTLATQQGQDILRATHREQQYRINTWMPRHEAIVEAFPEIPQSEEVLLMRLPLSTLLDMQADLRAA